MGWVIMKWFSADYHFGHKNILKFCSRPFNNVTEMSTALIRNHNEIVNYDDDVYILGDLCLGDYKEAIRYLSEMSGHKYVIPGSHDYRWLKRANYIWQVTGTRVLPPLVTLKLEGQLMVLCHYAMRVWDKSHYNSWNLFGHSHGRLRTVGKQYDVGVDSNNYRPVSLEELRVIMESKPDNVNHVGR